MLFVLRRTRQRFSEKFRRLKRSDRKEAVKQFKKRLGYEPPLVRPVSYNEKLTRFKLEADRPVFRQLADKLAVRHFVAERIGDKHLIPLIATAPRLTKELLDSLPDNFVIKANHGSAMNRIVFNKAELTFEDLKWEADGWICRNYFASSRESQYRQIPPNLVIEELLTDSNGKVPSDYKIHCFDAGGGQRHAIIQVDSDRFDNHSRDYFDTDWQPLKLRVKYPNSSEGNMPERPEKLDSLVEKAWRIADGLAYVRVDLYVVKGHVYFGEMTFTPGSGFERFEPNEVDIQWGKWFNLERQLTLFELADIK